MADDFRIQRYTEADRSSVFDLLQRAFSEVYAQHLIRTWNWKYDSHPLNREAAQVRRADHEKLWAYITQTYPADLRAQWGLNLDDLNPVPDDAPYILLLKAGDKVVATEGSLPRAFLINGERHLASIGCDFAVHPDYRGRQLSMRLALRTMSEHRISVGWYNTNSWTSTNRWEKKTAPALNQVTRTNPPASGKMRVVTLVKPIDWSWMIERATGIGLPASIAALASSGAHRVGRRRAKLPAMPGVDVFELKTFGRSIDDLQQRCSRDHQVIGIRDSAYLKWRLGARPDASYECVAAARDSQLIGYLAYRIVEREGGRIGYIVDFLIEGEPGSAFALLVAHAEDRMVRGGAQSIVCAIANARFRKVLHHCGFYVAVLGVRSYLSAEVNVPDAPTTVFADLPKWFVTIADGDAEMSF